MGLIRQKHLFTPYVEIQPYLIGIVCMCYSVTMKFLLQNYVLKPRFPDDGFILGGARNFGGGAHLEEIGQF